MDGVALARSARDSVTRESEATGDGRVAMRATPQERAQPRGSDRGDISVEKEATENGAAARRGGSKAAGSKRRRRAVQGEDDQLDARAGESEEKGLTPRQGDEEQQQRIATPVAVNGHARVKNGRQQAEPTTPNREENGGLHVAGFPRASAIDGQQRTEGTLPVSSPQPASAALAQGLDMVFQDEEPYELCILSSDGSPEQPPRQRRAAVNTPPAAAKPSASTRTTAVVSGLPREAPPKPGTDECEAKNPIVEEKPEVSTANAQQKTSTDVIAMQTNAEKHAVAPVDESAKPRDAMTAPSVRNKRGRRRKNLFPDSRSKAPGKKKQGEKSKSASSGVNGSALGITAPNGQADDGDVGSKEPPPSPVYPDADASHLYPSKTESAPWRWGDCDPFFAPLRQEDLDSLARWRKANANVVAANPATWRASRRVESERAVLEAILADASDATADHVKLPVRRGRNYRDVWDETDFLAQQRRERAGGGMLVGRTKTSKKRKSVVDAESPLLSHHDLVYGYDDSLFQDFLARLEARVEAAADQEDTASPSPTPPPPPPPVRRLSLLQNGNSTDQDASMNRKQGVIFDEEVLPSLPCRELHPASLGCWKLRKKQRVDFSVVHPASVNRNQERVRWKEEAERHREQQQERQCQQVDGVDDVSDGDEEGTGGSNGVNAKGRLHRATVANSEVNHLLPSFGNSMEEDEISRALAASVAKLVPLAMYNWRTSQLVYERAACSLQCAPILEAEAAASRALEAMFLQLFPPRDDGDDVPVRQPREVEMKSAPHDLIAYSVRRDLAGNCSLAVAASVEFALMRSVGDEVDVLDRNGCWNHGEVVEVYVESQQALPKFLLLRLSLWAEDAVEWIAVTEGRILPRGVADGSVSYSVGPTRAHRSRVSFDKHLASLLERSYPLRQAKQDAAAAKTLSRQQSGTLTRLSSHQHKPSQKRKRKRVGKTTGKATA